MHPATLSIARRASALSRQQRFPELLQLLHEVPPAQRNDRELHLMHGMALFKCGLPAQAVDSFLAALAFKMDDAAAHYHLGLCLREMGLKREAAECYRTALQLGMGPMEACVRAQLVFDLREICAWDGIEHEMDAWRATLDGLRPDAAMMTAPFVAATLLDSPATQLRAARACAAAIARAVRPLPRRARQSAPRLRVGYVSSDLREHATSRLMVELFERHDRERFEVTLYSHGIDDGSALRARVAAAAEHFVDARTLDDAQLAQRIRADSIDLLVDLKGHTRDNRLGVFAYRAAPLQASYLGYPGSTGAAFIDWIIGDAIVTPLSHAVHYSEKIAQLPGCYQPNDGQRALPPAPSRASLGLADGAVVLCAFHQPYKISPDVFDAWCGLLHELPNAVLWLLHCNDQSPANLEREAVQRGIAGHRLVWARQAAPGDHLARLRQADVFLDTWPCNGHTTASDALWAGVPVVTRMGETFASRVAASLLHAAGLPELACQNGASYRDTVVALARDAQRRAACRARLERARTESPLFDSTRRVRDLEALYTRLWDEGKP